MPRAQAESGDFALFSALPLFSPRLCARPPSCAPARAPTRAASGMHF